MDTTRHWWHCRSFPDGLCRELKFLLPSANRLCSGEYSCSQRIKERGAGKSYFGSKCFFDHCNYLSDWTIAHKCPPSTRILLVRCLCFQAKFVLSVSSHNCKMFVSVYLSRDFPCSYTTDFGRLAGFLIAEHLHLLLTSKMRRKYFLKHWISQ